MEGNIKIKVNIGKKKLYQAVATIYLGIVLTFALGHWTIQSTLFINDNAIYTYKVWLIFGVTNGRLR